MKMRVILRSLFSVPSVFRHRNAVRFVSSNAKKESNKRNEAEKIESEAIKNILVEKFGPVTTVSIDRQTSRNSLDILTLKQLSDAINAFDQDADAKVLVLTGEGGTFCSGFDVDELEEKGYNNMTDAASRLRRRPLCDKITIASVAGYAVAQGFELALSCDLRVIEDTAIIGCLGRRFGVPQSLLGGMKMTSLIGLSRSLDLLMTGRLISGTEANQFGLACKLTTTGTALGESVKLARSLSKFPQNALIMDKLASINSQLNPNSEESMRDEAVMTSLLGNAIVDISVELKKFQKGIGKHGKFHKLTEVPLQDWEMEDTQEEIILRPGAHATKRAVIPQKTEE